MILPWSVGLTPVFTSLIYFSLAVHGVKIKEQFFMISSHFRSQKLLFSRNQGSNFCWSYNQWCSFIIIMLGKILDSRASYRLSLLVRTLTVKIDFYRVGLKKNPCRVKKAPHKKPISEIWKKKCSTLESKNCKNSNFLDFFGRHSVHIRIK